MIMSTSKGGMHQRVLPWESISAADIPTASTLAASDNAMASDDAPSGVEADATSNAARESHAAPAVTVVLERQAGGRLAISDSLNAEEIDAEDESNPVDGAPDENDHSSAAELNNFSNITDIAGDGTLIHPLAWLGDWTVIMLCVGLGLICACVLIPQSDVNRRLVYEREKLRRDLDQIRRQVDVNQEFLRRIEDDPQLSERLAQRQMKMIREGSAPLDLKPEHPASEGLGAASASADRMSPFVIANVPAPSPLPIYQPVGGSFSDLCRAPRSQLLIMGGALFMIAAGLVLGSPGEKGTGPSNEKGIAPVSDADRESQIDS